MSDPSERFVCLCIADVSFVLSSMVLLRLLIKLIRHCTCNCECTTNDEEDDDTSSYTSDDRDINSHIFYSACIAILSYIINFWMYVIYVTDVLINDSSYDYYDWPTGLNIAASISRSISVFAFVWFIVHSFNQMFNFRDSMQAMSSLDFIFLNGLIILAFAISIIGVVLRYITKSVVIYYVVNGVAYFIAALIVGCIDWSLRKKVVLSITPEITGRDSYGSALTPHEERTIRKLVKPALLSRIESIAVFFALVAFILDAVVELILPKVYVLNVISIVVYCSMIVIIASCMCLSFQFSESHYTKCCKSCDLSMLEKLTATSQKMVNQ